MYQVHGDAMEKRKRKEKEEREKRKEKRKGRWRLVCDRLSAIKSSGTLYKQGQFVGIVLSPSCLDAPTNESKRAGNR